MGHEESLKTPRPTLALLCQHQVHYYYSKIVDTYADELIGGLYWWTHFFASPATRNPLSFLVGYSNTLGLVAGLVSIDCKFSGCHICTMGSTLRIEAL